MDMLLLMKIFVLYFQRCEMIDLLIQINDLINGIVWGEPVLVFIFMTGVFCTVRLGFIQFRYPLFILRNTIIRQFKADAGGTKTSHGEMTSFQAAMTSVCAIVGSGNIAGVATAIIIGGPGAVFWLIIAALFGMASKFAEIVLGIKYREIDENGTARGGAMYYLSAGLNKRWLGVLFACLVLPFAYIISGVVDSNTIAATLNDQFKVPPIVTGACLAIIVGMVIFGGIEKIGNICAVVAPFMGGLYLAAGILLIICHAEKLPEAVCLIIKGAFDPEAVTGGVTGSVFLCIKTGVARGLYSNEAGLGTAAMVHSNARVDHPVEQALWGPVEVFLDTIVVCTITALAIIMSGLWTTGEYDGASLTMAAFGKLLPGKSGSYIVLVTVILFCFSCLISYYVYVERAVEFIFGRSNKGFLKIIWVISIIVGSQTTLGFAWNLADTFNGLMIIPNLIGILLLSKEVAALKNEFFYDKIKK